MSNNKPIFEDFEKTVTRLGEVLKLEKTDINRDSAIKRFELCFDLAWKSFKAYAKNQGLECYSPRECFKTAFQLKLIEHDKEWLEMIEDRNRTAHLYNEAQANEVYSSFPNYLKLFEGLLNTLK